MEKVAPRPGIDYRDKAFVRDPFSFYKKMRRDYPVCLLGEDGNHFAISKFDISKQILGDYETFLSGSDVIGRPAWVEDKFKRDLFILTMEPPTHTKYRALVNKAFMPKVLASLEPFIRTAAEGLVAQLAGRSRFDFLGEFSLPYAVAIIGQITGDQSQSVEQLRAWTRLVDQNSYMTPDQAHITALQDATMRQYAVYDRIIAERRRNPKPDLLTELLEAEIGGERLSDLDIRAALDLFVSAGFQSSALLLTNSVRILARRPDLLEILKNNPEHIPSFIDEVLRFDSPAQSLLRHAAFDTEVNGIFVPKGALISIFIGSANRDEERFVHPEEFDIFRKDIKKQIGFGHGVHTCIGAALSRLEVRVAITAIVENFAGIECVDESELNWTNTLSIRAIDALPIRFI